MAQFSNNSWEPHVGAVEAAAWQANLDAVRDEELAIRRRDRALGLTPSSPGQYGVDYASLNDPYAYPFGTHLYYNLNPNRLTHRSIEGAGTSVGQVPSGPNYGHPFTGNMFTGGFRSSGGAMNRADYLSGEHNRQMYRSERPTSPVSPVLTANTPPLSRPLSVLPRDLARSEAAPFSSINTGLPAGNQSGHPFTGNMFTGGFTNPANLAAYCAGEHDRAEKRGHIDPLCAEYGFPTPQIPAPHFYGVNKAGSPGRKYVYPSRVNTPGMVRM